MSRRSARIIARQATTAVVPKQTSITTQNRRQDRLTVAHTTEELGRRSADESDSSAKDTAHHKTVRTPPEYVIPDVERKETKFKGRLGYACLNTIMRNKRPARESVFCSRTCRIDSIKKNGLEWVKELGRKNVEDLLKIIQWNEDNKIRLFRLSSEMFPFASHPIYGYSLEYCSHLLVQAGELARKYGHRLTAHPGQFTQLGSPKPGVIEASVRELKYHSEMLDLMGIGCDGVLVIHVSKQSDPLKVSQWGTLKKGGGMYEDKTATLERIKKTIQDDLPQRVRERLVLENDELCYSADDLLPMCEELDVPLVFDYHHDSLNPSSISRSEIIRRSNAIFHRRGITPKQHLSEPRPGALTIMEKRAHADRCSSLPTEVEEEGVSMEVDLMIEAKDKEQAVLELYRMYGLEEVKHESLRPPNENQTKETKGRKSNKRRKAQDDDDGNEEGPEEITSSRQKRRKNRLNVS